MSLSTVVANWLSLRAKREREVDILKSRLSYNLLRLEYLYSIRAGNGIESSWLNMMIERGAQPPIK